LLTNAELGFVIPKKKGDGVQIIKTPCTLMANDNIMEKCMEKRGASAKKIAFFGICTVCFFLYS